MKGNTMTNEMIERLNSIILAGDSNKIPWQEVRVTARAVFDHLTATQGNHAELVENVKQWRDHYRDNESINGITITLDRVIVALSAAPERDNLAELASMTQETEFYEQDCIYCGGSTEFPPGSNEYCEECDGTGKEQVSVFAVEEGAEQPTKISTVHTGLALVEVVRGVLSVHSKNGTLSDKFVNLLTQCADEIERLVGLQGKHGVDLADALNDVEQWKDIADRQGEEITRLLHDLDRQMDIAKAEVQPANHSEGGVGFKTIELNGMDSIVELPAGGYYLDGQRFKLKAGDEVSMPDYKIVCKSANHSALALDSHPDKPKDQSVNDETGYTPWTSEALDKVELKATNRAITAIVEALAAANLEVVEGWQPISTAPKDGTPVILDQNSALQRNTILTSWANGAWRDCYFEPTHWRPLPASPGDSK